ncbi:hypothetical protein JCM10213v2_008698 [Rhodosporidiobolus nylandii]
MFEVAPDLRRVVGESNDSPFSGVRQLEELVLLPSCGIRHAQTWHEFAPGSFASLNILDMHWSDRLHPRLSSFTALRTLTIRIEREETGSRKDPSTLHSLHSALRRLPPFLSILVITYQGYDTSPDFTSSTILLSALNKQQRGTALPALHELRIKACRARGELWDERERLKAGFAANGTVFLVEP